VLIAPILVPEVVLAVALLLFLQFLSLPKSFFLLLMGHVIFTLPFVVLVVQARLMGLRRDVEEAAQSLGASPVQTFFQVTLPLIMPAVLAGALLPLHHGQLPATLNYEHPDPRCRLNVIHGQTARLTGGTALSVNRTSVGQSAATLLRAL